MRADGNPFGFAPRPRRRRGVSLTPLIDIVFLLIVFFMLASSFAEPEAIGLQTAAAGTGSGGEPHVLVRLAADGGVTVNGRAVGGDGLEAHAATLVARRPDARFAVDAADDAPVQAIVDVIDALARAGAGRLVLVEQ